MTHTVHDVRKAAEQIGTKHRGDHRSKLTAIFDLVHGQITHSIAEAKTKPTVAEAVKVFEDTAAEYERHRAEVLAHLSD